MSEFFAWKRLVIALAVAIVAVVGTTIVHNIIDTPPQVVGSAPKLPAVQLQQPATTDLQQVEATLGSFGTLPVSSSNTPDTAFPAVLLIRQDGSIAASQKWTVPFSANEWAKQSSPQIAALSVSNGYATFKTSASGIFAYTVRVGQPFVLEQVPQYVMLIDAQGVQWSIGSTRAETLRRPL